MWIKLLFISIFFLLYSTVGVAASDVLEKKSGKDINGNVNGMTVALQLMQAQLPMGNVIAGLAFLKAHPLRYYHEFAAAHILYNWPITDWKNRIEKISNDYALHSGEAAKVKTAMLLAPYMQQQTVHVSEFSLVNSRDGTHMYAKLTTCKKGSKLDMALAFYRIKFQFFWPTSISESEQINLSYYYKYRALAYFVYLYKSLQAQYGQQFVDLTNGKLSEKFDENDTETRNTVPELGELNEQLIINGNKTDMNF